MLQVEDAEFVQAKGLTIPIALIVLHTRSVVNVCTISNDFLLVSLVTNRVSLEEVCLPIFDVLNCGLNLAEICLDNGNGLPLEVIASFYASRFFNNFTNGMSNNIHHPMDMSRLCNVECVHIYKF